MRLSPTDEPKEDRDPAPGGPGTTPTSDAGAADDDLPIALTVGAAAGIALVAGGLALRRRPKR
jgi:hypothetical protein